MLSLPQGWSASIDFADRTAALERIAREFDGWHSALTRLITDSDTALSWRPLFALPDGHRWQRRVGVTLLGDAAHLAPPNGEGANLAMLDGAQLHAMLASENPATRMAAVFAGD